MRKFIVTLVACLAAAIVLSISPVSAQPPGASQGAQVFIVPLSGDQEVPPVETDAFGLAIFTIRPNQQAIHYILITSPMDDVTQAHIHFGPAGTNGPVVAWLFGEPGNIPPTPNAGLLSKGTITADDLVGLMNDEPLSTLIDAMNAGNTYVNVHTTTFPPGEIRGQIHPAGP